jgi:surface antigen
MAKFTERTTAPKTDNRYYYADNLFYQSGYGLPNCTCYAWGRFWELKGGDMPRLSLHDAENWWDTSDGYERGQTPKLGAVICWRVGDTSSSSDGVGHVAIVERINADGSIITSESGWGASSTFWRTTRTKGNGNWGASAKYTFQGFIYHPIEWDDGATGDYISGNRFLTLAEMQQNARYIWRYLAKRGWTLNAVAGMLGNMETESTINPAIWETLDEGNTVGGFGLVQWTPATKLITWAENRGLEFDEMDTQLQRILYEVENGGQWYKTSDYPLSFAQFTTSTKSPRYLAMAFLANYERPANPNQPTRGDQAEYWVEYLANSDPDIPIIPAQKKKRSLSLLLMWSATRRKAR